MRFTSNSRSQESELNQMLPTERRGTLTEPDRATNKRADHKSRRSLRSPRKALFKRLDSHVTLNESTDYGVRNSTPRSAFNFLVSSTSRSEIGTLRARCSVSIHSVWPTIAEFWISLLRPSRKTKIVVAVLSSVD